MEKDFFVNTVVPTEFDLGRTEKANKLPKKADASPSYHAGYDTPDALKNTLRAWVIQVATAGYDDSVAGSTVGKIPDWPELKDETTGTKIQGDDPRIYDFQSDIVEVYNEGRDAPKSPIPPGFEQQSTFSIRGYTFATVGAIAGGLAGLGIASLLGGGLITKVGTAAAGAFAGGLYLKSKAS